MSRLCLIGLALFAAVSGSVSRAAIDYIDYTDPPQGLFLDEWMSVEMMGGKVGYVHSELTRSGDEIQTVILTTMVFKRAGSEVSVVMRQTTRETLDGTPMAFTSQMEMSKQVMETAGVIEGGKVRITTKQFGMSSTREYDFPRGAVMSWGMLLAQEAHGYAEGTKYSLKLYEPSLGADRAMDVKVEVFGKETIEVGGKPLETVRLTQQMMGLDTIAWVDAEGAVVRTKLNLMGTPMIMSRTTKEEALAEFSSPEFFMPTTIKAGRPIDRQKARTIEYVLKARNAESKLPDMPDTAMQTVLGRDDGVLLVVKRLDHNALRAVAPREYGPQLRSYLDANPIINSDDPAVRAMAVDARGDAKMPYEIADRLRRYVTDVISDKNLDVGFASASEVCRDKAGDCSEHAVLLAALGRACGLPTRVATGIVYVPTFGGDQDIFGFHMWAQFLIGDTWVDFDAAQRESDCNPTHIAFNVSSLKGAGLGQIAFSLVNVIGNLDLKVQRIELAE